MRDDHSDRRTLIPHDVRPAKPNGTRIVHWSGETMGTTWSVRAVAPPTLNAALTEAALLAVLDTIIAQMSTWRVDSQISRFNELPAGESLPIGGEFLAVLECAAAVAEETGGAFDPTLGALVDLWGFGARVASGAPSGAQIAEALRSSGWRQITPSSQLVRPGGLRLDLSGIAKGYAVDALAQCLLEAGFNSFLVEIGGELRGVGMKPDAQPWWVEIEEPPGSPRAPILAALHNLAIASSGDYRRMRIEQGEAIAHTIDPRTGRPLVNGVAAVTVLHETCTLADAYATALMVLGPDEGLAFAAAHDLAVRFVLRDQSHTEIASPAFNAMLD